MTLRTRCVVALLAMLGATAPATPLAGQTEAPKAVILSPEPGELVPGDQVLVAVTLPPADSVSVRIGLRDVSAEAALENGVLTWRPSEPLAPGPHRVVVSARGADPLAWTFTVAPAHRVAQAAVPGAPAPRPRSRIIPHGSLVMEGGATSVSGSGEQFSRQEEFLPRMWFNAGGELRPGWRYTARAHVTGYESSDRQPVNRFRADLRTPALQLAVGDVNPVLHDVILAGRHVRGGQVGLRLGPLHLDAVAGRTRRSIDGALQPLDPTLVLRPGTYEQNMFAVRPSLGVGDRFRVGFTVMRTRDDVESIPLLRTQPSAVDSSTASANPAPRDNLVAGLDVTLRLAGGRFTARYENAASLLTRDITERPRTRAELDSIFADFGVEAPGVDPGDWDDFIILNGTLVPLDPRELTNMAHQVRTTLRAGAHTLSAEWRSVGIDYHSFGHPGLQRDLRGWRVRDSFTLPGEALFVTAGLEHDRDNLDGSALATTTTNAAFATLTWQAPREMVFTGSLRLGTRGNSLAQDETGALDQSTRALSLGALVPVALVPSLRTRLTLNGSWVSRSDPANPVGDTRDLYYLAGIQGETEDRETDFSLQAGQNRSDFPGLDGANTTFDRVVVAARRQLTPRWAARFDGGLTTARSPAGGVAPGPRYTRTEALGGGEWQWRNDMGVTFTTGIVSYSDQRAPALDTRELVARVRLSRAF
ncbi:MAG TPA: hypothetical protein VFS20_01690 [Longimicrobium sp.]|nr:hypothetical protein [Longimicrobium sp.]